MKRLLKNALQIVTCNTNGINFKRGKDLSELDILENHSILEENGLITDIIPDSTANNKIFDEVIDLKGKVLLPGLIECHTHSAFAGSRAKEFKKKISGATYEEIAREGGGILSTVEAVRKTDLTDLIRIVSPRVTEFISQGITTLEIKSGYGLDFENEVKLLHSIKILDEIFAVDIVSTFLGAHSLPHEFKKDRAGYINLITQKIIPHIAKNNLAEFCDAFCESTAFTPDEIDTVFASAAEAGLKIKIHTEQFNNIGGLDLALKHNAISVDHLEVLKESDLCKFNGSNTVAVLLPGVSLYLDYDFAPARKLIENNAIVALSSDYNPGSSPILNFHLIMSLAAIKMKMNIEEIINSVTINAAKALNLENKVGSIEIGKFADFSAFEVDDYSEIIYNIGRNAVTHTIKKGNVIYEKPSL